MGSFINSIREHNQKIQIAKDIQTLKDNGLYGHVMADVEATAKLAADLRYNVPKEAPKASEELVEETIVNTEIYRRARLAVAQAHFLSGESRTAILEAQRKQVAYGLDKYPEPLNPNTWTIGETVEHIMDESIDRLHYLIMLRIKLEQQLVSGAFNDILEVKNTNSRIASISRMIDNTIEELHYLVTLVVVTDRETEAQPEEFSATKVMRDAIDSIAYTLNNGEGLMWAKNGIDMTNSDTLRVFTDDELEALSKGGKFDE